MNIPGMKYLKRVRGTGNEVEVPMTRNLGLVDLLIETYKQASKDNLSSFAKSLVYSEIFALFPFFTLLLSLLGLFHMTSLVNTLFDQAGQAMPSGLTDTLQRYVLKTTQTKASGAFSLAAIISIIAAVWGVSGGFRSVMTAMNVMYNVEEKRPFWKQILISILLSIAVVVLLIAALVLLVFGGDIGRAVANAVGLGSVFVTVWSIVRWPVLALFVLFSFALIYYYTPDTKQKFRFVSPGSLIAFVLWLVFSLLFSLYVNNFGSYNKSYGTFAGIAILLLYLYYASYIMLMGAEFNQVIEAHAPGGKNAGEKVPEEDKPPAQRQTESTQNA